MAQSTPNVAGFTPVTFAGGRTVVYEPLSVDVRTTRIRLRGLHEPSERSEEVRGTRVTLEGPDENPVARVEIHHRFAAQVDASGLSRAELLDVVASIPLLAERERFDSGRGSPVNDWIAANVVETWIDLGFPVEHVEGSGIVPLHTPTHGNHDTVVKTGQFDDDAMALAILTADLNPLSSTAMIVPDGKLYEIAGVSVVAGGGNGRGSERLTRAVWVHRDRFFHLVSTRGLSAVLPVVAPIISQVEEVA